MSDEHFTVDGTLLEAWASLKSFRPKDAAAVAAARRSRQPHRRLSWRDADERHARVDDRPRRPARIAKGRGKEAKLAYLGHVLLDNRHGLVANVCATAATGTAEREAARAAADDRRRARRPSAATRTMTSRSLSRRSASWRSRRTSRRKPAAAPSMDAPTRHPATRSASANASWSNRCLAG